MTSILTRAAREPDRVLRYSEAPTGVIDVFDGERGLLVLIHGGFWRARYDRLHLRPLAAALADAGWRVALPEFRRVGDPGGGWPGTVDDVRRLVRQLPTLLGAESITLIGHSAGGHLAMLAAADPDARVTRVVSLAGVLDLVDAQRRGLSDGAADEFLAGAPVAVADPMTLPVPHTDLVLLHGLADDEVPVEHSRRFAERDAGIRLVTPECGHYELIDPQEPEFALLLAAL